MSDKKINIEKLLDELENIVKKMEDDNLNLEQSLESYEKGIGLVKQAQSTLTEIEKKVKILSKKDGLKDFDTDD
ncbi:MAG: exodeoxyribonuclease VII small subunit [Methylophilaceae bacterium]|jgi:exodeoxyribonuclease VII small subunit